jgi:hypothetical protein
MAKTGKPKYFASKRDTSEKGVIVDSLPDEFEIFEDPGNATVSVRRRRPSRILPPERDLVDQLAVELSAYSCVQTIIDGDRIVVYTPDTDPEAAAATLARIFGSAPSTAADWTRRNTAYSAEIRFTIHDVDERTYLAERYCYRSSIDRWIHIGGPARLEPLARKLLPHLGQESFYDLSWSESLFLIVLATPYPHTHNRSTETTTAKLRTEPIRSPARPPWQANCQGRSAATSSSRSWAKGVWGSSIWLMTRNWTGK